MEIKEVIKAIEEKKDMKSMLNTRIGFTEDRHRPIGLYYGTKLYVDGGNSEKWMLIMENYDVYIPIEELRIDEN